MIIDLPLNHSSDKHPWFTEAAEYLRNLPEDKEPDPTECPYVEYYNFSKEGGSGYAAVEGSSWFYEAKFWSGMPDLNLESEAVRKEFEEIASFWLDMGIDGFRLDAVKEFVSGSAETNISILKWFNDYVKSVSPDAYIVCECWEPQNVYAQYYSAGVDSMFDFKFADKSGVIANVMKGSSDASAYGKAVENAQELYASYNSEYINAPFYTNHDMGRSAGYYAGENSTAQIKMGHALNLLMSGSAFVYYGEELGMKGAGKDENKRAPMYWSMDENTEGMCDGPKDMDEVKMIFDSLEEQVNDTNSVYRYVRNVIRLRNQNPEIARGTADFLDEYSDDKLCLITKTYEEKTVLLIMNTSPENVKADLNGVTVQGKDISELNTLGQLLTGEDETLIDGNTVEMPPYSVLLLGVGE